MPKRLFLLVAVLSAGTLASPARAGFELTILHVNDVHSRVEPVNRSDATCTATDAQAGNCFGGVARLKTAIDRQRAAGGPNVLVLDAGDQFQGSLFFTTYKGRDTAEFMNEMGFEAMAAGNHEFDDGPRVLADFVNRIHFPMLMANADLDAEPDLKAGILPATVVTKNGEKIGIVGLSPKDTPELASPGPNVTFEDPIPAVEREVAKLEEQGVTKIVLLSHSGFEADKRIAAAVDGVDVIVGGHSHTLLSNTEANAAGSYPTMVAGPSGRAVPIVQAGAYGRYLGELRVRFDDEGNVVAAEGNPIPLDGSIPEDPAFKARVAELAAPLEKVRGEVVARVAGPVDGSRENCRIAECQMGTLMADAMLDRVRNEGATIAIANGGGLRASIDAGDVTMGEVLAVLPFQNTLATFELKGSEIVEALEAGVSGVQDLAGRFPQVAGLRFDWSPQTLPNGGRIKAVRVRRGEDWAPIDPDATYGVVSNNYLRGGGDGYAVFARQGTNAYDFGPALETVLADYLARRPATYQPYTDGRIRNLDR